MRRDALAAAALFAAVAAPISAQDAAPAILLPEPVPVTLPSGSLVPVVTREELTSQRHRKGDLLTLEVGEDVVIDGHIAIPQGTPVVAELTLVEKKGLMGHAGKLEARTLYMELPSGPVRLSGELAVAGRSQTGLATAATALVSGFAFVITGKSAVIPAGTSLIAVLDRDVTLR